MVINTTIEANEFLIDLSDNSGSATSWNTFSSDVTDSPLTDQDGNDNDVTLTITGIQGDNNPNPAGATTVDGITVPLEANNDYVWSSVDPANILFEFKNLDPGYYNISVFAGRTDDATQEGILWSGVLGDEPATNTGDYANSSQTLVINISSGDSLYFRTMKGNDAGGTSGFILRRPSDVRLSGNIIISNSPIGTFIGNVTYDLSLSNTSYNMGSSADNLLFQVLPTGNALIGEIRSKSFLSSGNFYDITISANNNSGNTKNSNFMIGATTTTGPQYTIDADVKNNATNGVVIATLVSQSGASEINYSLTYGRTDLMAISGNNLVVSNASSWITLNAEKYVTIKATDAFGNSTSIVVKVTVKKASSGTIIRID